ncbi:hypothetical protein [Corynebacterium ulcerans]|uniref:hypothetical protein n=1 Tax=Corynebacterium ulcerans TaxID=65058 RepID=UPI0034A1F207
MKTSAMAEQNELWHSADVLMIRLGKLADAVDTLNNNRLGYPKTNGYFCGLVGSAR